MLVLVGAWLVLPFTGIELLAVGIAFAIYARHAVDYECVRLFPGKLVAGGRLAYCTTRGDFKHVDVPLDDDARAAARLVDRRVPRGADRRADPGATVRRQGA